MRERLMALAAKLAGMRDEVLSAYLDELDKFTAKGGNPSSVIRIGILSDLDKHITNCEMEIQRIEKMAAFKEISAKVDAGMATVGTSMGVINA